MCRGEEGFPGPLPPQLHISPCSPTLTTSHPTSPDLTPLCTEECKRAPSHTHDMGSRSLTDTTHRSGPVTPQPAGAHTGTVARQGTHSSHSTRIPSQSWDGLMALPLTKPAPSRDSRHYAQTLRERISGALGHCCIFEAPEITIGQ